MYRAAAAGDTVRRRSSGWTRGTWTIRLHG